jgi:acetyl-CoA carboxylase carboxyl transferase subunit beta
MAREEEPTVRFVDRLLDPGTFQSWDGPPDQGRVSEEYAATLARAAARAGADEAVATGEGLVHGRPVAVAAGEFGFLGGSIGRAAALRLIAAVERATARRLPLLMAPSSGGTRMQEGTSAFVRMVDIARAVAAHKAEGLPYLVHLRHPTTGGVFASWASQGQVTTAEPGALVGFLGPRVYEALHGEPFPAGVQTAENLASHGVIDAVVPVERLRGLVRDVLEILAPGTGTADVASPNGDSPVRVDDVWDSVLRTRDPGRPGCREVLAAADLRVPLSGTGEGERDDNMLIALASFGGRPCVLAGHGRAEVTPTGLRVAQRAVRLAEELRVPLVTVIDTPGAELSREAEEGALAGEISRCIEAMVRLPVRTVSVLMGRGSGGAALALLPADRVVAAGHAWLAPLPPEGASAILHRTTGHAAEVARAQRIGAPELFEDGIVHRVLAEPDDPAAFVAVVVDAIGDELRRP